MRVTVNTVADGPTAEVAHLLYVWHQVDPRPSLLITAKCQMLWANPAAEIFLEQSELAGLIDGNFILHDPSHHQDFCDYLATTTTGPKYWSIKSEGGQQELTFWIFVLGQTRDAFGVRISGHGAPLYAGFQDLYGLTGAEERVLLRLLSGQVASAIAQANRGSLQTVRAQIKAIYSKMGVSSREGLFFAANRGRIP